MKSKEIRLSDSASCMKAMLDEVERTCSEAGLERIQVGLMRLLAEEMVSMTKDILKSCKGTLWLEGENNECELHLTVVAPIEEEAKAAFIEASKSKVNAPVKGLKNKISALMAGMLSCGDYPELYGAMSAGFIGGYTGMDTMAQMPVWSLAVYENSIPVKEKDAEMAGVEKSILIAMADDVIVSVKSHWVEVVVQKKFGATV